jgi:hypothetical protein
MFTGTLSSIHGRELVVLARHLLAYFFRPTCSIRLLE